MDHIELHVNLNAILKLGKLDEEPKAIALRPTPSSVLTRSLDKGKTYESSFQILIKDPNQMIALDTLNKITVLLDGLSNSAITSENDSFIFVKCEAYVLPNYVDTTDHEEYIYTAMFTAEIEGGN